MKEFKKEIKKAEKQFLTMLFKGYQEPTLVAQERVINPAREEFMRVCDEALKRYRQRNDDGIIRFLVIQKPTNVHSAIRNTTVTACSTREQTKQVRVPKAYESTYRPIRVIELKIGKEEIL